jgi:hypothetical protein
LYYYLIGALKRRLILELQDSFGRHPVYRKLASFIQNRQAFEERPQFGIIVQGSSANKVQLDASNFIGTVQSRVMLAQVGPAVFPLEWVREDLECSRSHSSFPTAPGVYYIEILTAPKNPGEEGAFVIDPLLTVTNEPVLRFQTGLEQEGQLQNVPVDRTLRLYEDRSFLLSQGTHYEVLANGGIKFLQRFRAGVVITADYRHAAPSIGPVPFKWNTSNTTILPGVVLAFGKRAEAGQKVAVVVYRERVETAQAYGGKHEASFDLEVLSRDTTQVEEIADLVVMYLWAEKRPVLGWEGIEIIDVSSGGESEEAVDETGQDFQYSTSMSVQLSADWEIHVPLALTISNVEPQAQQVVSPDLFYQTFPIVAGRNPDFERIG